MDQPTDAALLRRYAESGSEAAFAELVHRHADLVYSSALRQCRSADLAAEISQTVFVDLALKARSIVVRFRPDSSIAGWLYQAVRFATLEQLRRLHRHPNPLPMTTEDIASPTVGDPVWKQVAPMLDEAMEELPEPDRLAVVLRYFQNQDFRTVGRALGVSDDAAQKRVSRAVEQLRGLLARRGVLVAAEGLVVAITAEAVCPAPDTLAAAIRHALPISGVGTVTIAIPSATKLPRLRIPAVIGAVVALGVVGTFAMVRTRELPLLPEPVPPQIVAAAPESAAPALVLPASVAPATEQPNLDSYPWSETEDTVRVPKSFLEGIDVHPLTMTNDRTREFVLQSDFVRIFKLTTAETMEVQKALAQALDSYRKEEALHLVRTEEGPKTDPAPAYRQGPAAVEKVHYSLKPFPEQAGPIRTQLEARILSILGEQRSKSFWKQPGMVEGEIRSFTAANYAVPETFTFQLTDAHPGPFVDMYHSGGGSSGGFTYHEPLDQYAPEDMKPTLARWRAAIANGTVGSRAAAERANAPAPEPPEPEASSQRQSPTAPLAPWNDAEPYVDLPKSYLETLRIPGLASDQTVTAEAATLFDLTHLEQESIRILYAEFKLKALALEQAHFKRPDPIQHRYVLNPFPETKAALEADWAERLEAIVGKNRAHYLDKSLRTPEPPWKADRRRMESPGEAPDWFRMGTQEVIFQIGESDQHPGGRRMGNIRIEVTGQGGGSFGGYWDGKWTTKRIPERWRHLLTPEMVVEAMQ